MRRRFIVIASLCAAAAAIGACVVDTSEVMNDERQLMGEYSTAATGGYGGAGGAPQCEETTTTCFDVMNEKDISFIAVLAEPCEGAAISYDLFYPDMTPVQKTPKPHGQGKPCERAGIGIDPAALKFEGLSKKHYILCVTYDGVATPGDILVTAKAGQACWEDGLASECSECPPPNGSGGAPPNGAGGYGGDPKGDGGCPYSQTY